MEIYYNIERIENGYIVTGNDSSQSKRFYESIERFIESNIQEPVREIQEAHRTSESDGEILQIRFVLEPIKTK